MRFLLQLAFIGLVALLLAIYLPWWGIAVSGFAGGLLLRSRANFLAGFIAIALLWLVMALYIDGKASTLLTEKVAAVLTVNKVLLFVITALVGGFVGGMSAVAGSLLRRPLKKVKRYS